MEPDEFTISDLGKRIGEIERHIDQRNAFSVVMPADSKEFASATNFLNALTTGEDSRTAWAALVDAWRIGDFISCLGMSKEVGYRWKVSTNNGLARIVFECK